MLDLPKGSVRSLPWMARQGALRVYWVHGVTGALVMVHGFTGLPTYRFTGLRIHRAASVHAVVVSHHVAADGGGTSSGLCDVLDQNFC